MQSFMNLSPCKRIDFLSLSFILWIIELFQKRTVKMSKVHRFLKYIRHKPSFKDIMLCSALLLLAISLMLLSDNIFDENGRSVGTIVSLGIVILVGILAVRNK